MRILFLGENSSQLSAECLDALLKAECGEVTVGIGAVAEQAWRRRVINGLRRHGLRRELQSFVRRRLRWHDRTIKDILAAHPAASRFEVANINSPVNVTRLRTISPDVIFVVAFQQLLKPAVIAVPRLGCINVHPSLLPQYRGPAPYYWAQRNRERVTGVTIHYVDEGIDTGDIITQEAFEIETNDNDRSLRKKSAVIGARLILETARRLAAGETLPRRPQDHAQATYFASP
jgi:methionyl-tRNA formyltransferase